jgi:hypothetical protein
MAAASLRFWLSDSAPCWIAAAFAALSLFSSSVNCSDVMRPALWFAVSRASASA